MRFSCHLLTAALCILTACQHPTTLGPQVSSQEVAAESAHQERAMAQVRAQGGLARPWRNRKGMHAQFERVANRIEKAGADVCRGMGLPQQGRSCYYYFEILRDRDINASADGTTVFINGGMLRFVGSDDELAGVMAHELAHNLMGHTESKTTNAYIGAALGAVLDTAVTTKGMRTGNDLQDMGAYMGAVGYSPDFEREADYVGLYIMARAGYDIRQVPNYWRRLSLEEPNSANGGVTHPSNAERFVAMQKGIEEISYKRAHHMPVVPNLKEDVTN